MRENQEPCVASRRRRMGRVVVECVEAERVNQRRTILSSLTTWLLIQSTPSISFIRSSILLTSVNRWTLRYQSIVLKSPSRYHRYLVPLLQSPPFPPQSNSLSISSSSSSCRCLVLKSCRSALSRRLKTYKRSQRLASPPFHDQKILDTLIFELKDQRWEEEMEKGNSSAKLSPCSTAAVQ